MQPRNALDRSLVPNGPVNLSPIREVLGNLGTSLGWTFGHFHGNGTMEKFLLEPNRQHGLWTSHVEDTSPPARAPGPQGCSAQSQEVPPELLRSGRRGLCRAEWRPAAAPDVGGEGREAPLSGTETWRKTLGKSWENWENHGRIARENRVWILNSPVLGGKWCSNPQLAATSILELAEGILAAMGN